MKLSPFSPVDPRKSRVYYGWLLVPCAAIGLIMSTPGQTAGFSAFTEPILGFTSFSRTYLSILYMAGTLISGFTLPFAGGLLDRWGARKMMILTSLFLGASLLWLSFIDRIAASVKILPLSVSYTLLLVFGIFSLRFLGQGLLTMTSNTMVAKWFDQRRGRAMAILGASNSLAFSAAPALMAMLVGRLSWDGAWRILALVVGIGMSLIAFIFYRDTPEGCGLSVDGLEPAEPQDPGTVEVEGLSRDHAVKTRAFWSSVTVISLNALVMTGLTFHIQAIGSQAGLSLDRAVAIFIPISFISIPTSFFSSILIERIRPRFFILLMAFSEFAGYTAIFFLNTQPGYICTIVGLGIANGCMGTILAAVIPKIFGRRHLGSINGLVTSIMVISSALGPVFLSMINDLIGSLKLGVSMMGALSLLVAVFSFRMQDEFSNSE